MREASVIMSIRSYTILSTAVLAVSTLAMPARADAWTAQWHNVVSWSTHYVSGAGYYARLYDTANDNVPVRAQYGRTNGVSYNLYNPNGNGSSVQGPIHPASINRTILCNDYPFGDDCSPEYYG